MPHCSNYASLLSPRLNTPNSFSLTRSKTTYQSLVRGPTAMVLVMLQMVMVILHPRGRPILAGLPCRGAVHYIIQLLVADQVHVLVKVVHEAAAGCATAALGLAHNLTHLCPRWISAHACDSDIRFSLYSLPYSLYAVTRASQQCAVCSLLK